VFKKIKENVDDDKIVYCFDCGKFIKPGRKIFIIEDLITVD
jgi:hypothetical protein